MQRMPDHLLIRCATEYRGDWAGVVIRAGWLNALVMHIGLTYMTKYDLCYEWIGWKVAVCGFKNVQAILKD